MAKQSRMPASLAARIEANPPPLAAVDRVDQLRRLVVETRDLELRKTELEQQLEQVNRDLNGDEGMYFKTLPNLMQEIGLTVMTLEADGNIPEVTVTAGPFYMANIAAGWPEEKRKAAFEWLDQNGHGDGLIKTEVTLSFPRDQRKEALKYLKIAQKFGAATIKEAVPWNTLTAWLREQVEEEGEMPPLDIIGGTVTRSVKLKFKKD